MSPLQAVQILRTVSQSVAATPADHSQIAFALATLESLAKTHEATNPAPKTEAPASELPAKARKKR